MAKNTRAKKATVKKENNYGWITNTKQSSGYASTARLE